VGGGASRTWPFALPWLARDFGGVQHFQAAVGCCDCCWLLTSAGVTQELIEQFIPTVGTHGLPGAVGDMVPREWTRQREVSFSMKRAAEIFNLYVN